MRGRFADRRGGWDCHGLPVEIEVERRLGISGKPQIEAYGIAEFNALCRESVVAYVDEWERLTERIGFWIDTERAYRTMDADYIESVWWSLAGLYRRGLLLVQSDKVVPTARVRTALSSHEVALGYEESRTRRSSCASRWPTRRASRCSSGRPPRGRSRPTRPPWSTRTSPTRRSSARRPDLAEALVERVLGEGAAVARRVPAGELVGRRYRPPFPYVDGPARWSRPAS